MNDTCYHSYRPMNDTPQLISEPSPEEISQAVAVVPATTQHYSPSDAKDKAVSDLIGACYAKASQLKLEREEIEALKADFPDEAFQPGAAGKENLIYIEHAALRERLDNVLGMGQWCPIQIRRWAEPFEYEKDVWENNRRTGAKKTVTGQVIYIELVLLIRSCFVASAIGSMDYYPDNHTQDYGDAAEGAETAALRRCCKHIGIGLQAWRKDWTLGWWERHNAKKRTRTQRTHQPTQRDPAPPPPQPKPHNNSTQATEKQRSDLIKLWLAGPGQEQRGILLDYMCHKGWIKGAQTVEDWPLQHVPRNKVEQKAFIVEWDRYIRMKEAQNAPEPELL